MPRAKLGEETHRLNVILEKEVYERLRVLAFKKVTTIGKLIRDAIEEFLKKQK